MVPAEKRLLAARTRVLRPSKAARTRRPVMINVCVLFSVVTARAA
jgi:hypothetical protein